MTRTNPVQTMNLPPYKHEKCLPIAAYKIKLQNGEHMPL